MVYNYARCKIVLFAIVNAVYERRNFARYLSHNNFYFTTSSQDLRSNHSLCKNYLLILGKDRFDYERNLPMLLTLSKAAMQFTACTCFEDWSKPVNRIYHVRVAGHYGEFKIPLRSAALAYELVSLMSNHNSSKLKNWWANFTSATFRRSWAKHKPISCLRQNLIAFW